MPGHAVSEDRTRDLRIMRSACCQLRSHCCLRAHGVVVSHPLRMRKALGSIPSVSKLAKLKRRNNA